MLNMLAKGAVYRNETHVMVPEAVKGFAELSRSRAIYAAMCIPYVLKGADRCNQQETA